MSVFDQLRAYEPSDQPEKWRPQNPGDEILGILRRIDTRTDPSGREYQIASLELEDRSLVNVSVTAVIRSEFEEQAVQIGDGVRLIFQGVQKTRSGTTYKRFDVFCASGSTTTSEEIF